jgi:hypothetical protein
MDLCAMIDKLSIEDAQKIVNVMTASLSVMRIVRAQRKAVTRG